MSHPPPGTFRVFTAEELLPAAWRHFTAEGPVRAFNPGLLREHTGWLFAYRLVAPDGRRRIGLCRLDERLEIVAGSARAFSDAVRFRTPNDYASVALEWFADPRLYRFDERVFVYWNSGWHEPRNHQFLQEIDPATLAPLGIARELVLAGERQKLEKNWMLFAAPGDTSEKLHAIYSIAPHRVLELSLAGAGDIEFREMAATSWSLSAYPASHGGLRGGAPPQLADGKFWSFCHSVHDGVTGYRYAAAAYAFEAREPFAPVAEPVHALALPNPFGEERMHPRLNPAVSEVIYPCGAARAGDAWAVSYGINDERCAIAMLDAAEVAQSTHTIAGR